VAVTRHIVTLIAAITAENCFILLAQSVYHHYNILSLILYNRVMPLIQFMALIQFNVTLDIG